MKKHAGIVIFLISFIVAVCLIVFIRGCLSGTFVITSSRRPADRYQEAIPGVHASTDADHDGIDDQSDILANALEYISTRPAYKSKYYSSGYPDDGYGTCVDVIGFALKGAGYDLQDMVDNDIHENMEEYQIEKPDRNIDFRRVRNLKVFFKNHAKSLTTDTDAIEEWQGGDIVIFEGHIGIVSDRRNKDGIPYIIHHSGPFQLAYEEDILQKRKDIIGHYRFP